MPWSDGTYSVSHPREPWSERDGEWILAHTSWPKLKAGGIEDRSGSARDRYLKAKQYFDLDAAYEIVKEVLDSSVVDELAKNVAASGMRPLLVFPIPGYDDEDTVSEVDIISSKPTNALPFAYRALLAKLLEGIEENNIVLESRVGRTKLTRFGRYLFQPSFYGNVNRERPYILLDDVCTLGGTLAALRSHIIRNGGTVIAYSALANDSGRKSRFSIDRATLDMLKSMYGEPVFRFWKETIGHDLESTTQNEGKFLVEWARQHCAEQPAAERLQRLRERLNKEAASLGDGTS